MGVHRHRRQRRAIPDPATTERESLDDFVFAVTADLDMDAEARYADAVARRDAIRTAGKPRASPLPTSGSTGQLVEHPFVKMLRPHDVLVDRLAVTVRKRHRGPEPSAVIKPSIGESPAAKLRAVI